MTNHYVAPSGFDRVVNRAIAWLADRGINLAGAQTLTVVGRKTGTPQRVPVNPIRIDGTEYLVAVRGDTQWVRNARAAGEAQLRRGRRVRTVTVAELPTAERFPILRAYLDKWGWEVGRFLPEGLTVNSDDAEFAAHLASMPVFALGSAA